MTSPGGAARGLEAHEARATRAPASAEQVVIADWTWVDGRLVPDVAVGIASGRFSSMGPSQGRNGLRLVGKALIPGFVSAHSHAFQRGLRGAVERARVPGEFFSWRTAMYELVERLTPDLCYDLSKQCFAEMLSAGITSVGEFHYVRHVVDARDDSSEDRRYVLDAAVLAAARDAGIRIALLSTCYMTGGFGVPLAGGQIRFRTRDEREYWDRFDAIARLCDASTQSVAVTAHSVRAVPIDVIERLHAESVRRGLVFHIHLEEVRQEIADCLKTHGKRPAELLLERLAIDRRFTAVHCTHTSPEDLRRLAACGATVCLCPLTEGNLGDGLCAVDAFSGTGGRLAIGTDLNSRLAPTEELRWLEYAQRLRREVRGAVVNAQGDCGAELLAIGTANGAASIGVDAGAIDVGRWADCAVIDLGHPSLAGWTPETFASHLVFGTGTAPVCGTCVGGRWTPCQP